MAEKRRRRTFDKQFKRDAVDLVLKRGRSVASVARDLDIGDHTLHKWKRQVLADGQRAFPGNGNAQDAEFRALERRALIAEEERDILKKALAVFSRRPQ
jgi:transposase